MFARIGWFVILLAFPAWTQSSDKIFYLAHLDSPQAIQEVTNAIRSIGDIRDVSIDLAKKSISVKGTPDQIAIAGWLTAELDQSGTTPGIRDFAFNDPRAPQAQVVHLARVENPADL